MFNVPSLMGGNLVLVNNRSSVTQNTLGELKYPWIFPRIDIIVSLMSFPEVSSIISTRIKSELLCFIELVH